MSFSVLWPKFELDQCTKPRRCYSVPPPAEHEHGARTRTLDRWRRCTTRQQSSECESIPADALPQTAFLASEITTESYQADRSPGEKRTLANYGTTPADTSKGFLARYPSFVWAPLCGYQSTFSRLKLLVHISVNSKEKVSCCCKPDERLPCSQSLPTTRRTTPAKTPKPAPVSDPELKVYPGGVSMGGGAGKRFGNEDAFACSKDGRFLLVVDGVGQWSTWNVDVSVFASRFVELVMVHDEERRKHMTSPRAHIASCLCSSLMTLYSERIYGAVTCSAALFFGEQVVIVTIGDCTFMVLRRTPHGGGVRRNIYRRSDGGRKRFNCPEQLSVCPSENDLRMAETTGCFGNIFLSGGKVHQDLWTAVKVYKENEEYHWARVMEEAVEMTLNVREGDMIVMVTDGVGDNLFDIDLTRLLTLPLSPEESRRVVESEELHPSTIEHPLKFEQSDCGYSTPPEVVARAVVEASMAMSKNVYGDTPWHRGTRGKPMDKRGGKEDDATCLVAWLTFLLV